MKKQHYNHKCKTNYS